MDDKLGPEVLSVFQRRLSRRIQILRTRFQGAVGGREVKDELRAGGLTTLREPREDGEMAKP